MFFGPNYTLLVKVQGGVRDHSLPKHLLLLSMMITDGVCSQQSNFSSVSYQYTLFGIVIGKS